MDLSQENLIATTHLIIEQKIGEKYEAAQKWGIAAVNSKFVCIFLFTLKLF